MKLFIVESPSKCGKLRKILGPDFKLMASVGHIRQIPKKGMNIDIKGGFIPTYEVTADRKKVVKEIKEAAAEADKIYLASDPDREGEAIAWSIYDELNAACRKKCVRVEFNEISKSAVDKAMSKERAVDMDKVQAQKARQVLDRLIGYKISPILWNEIGAGTSAGRVQSIALKIVCLREKEIKEFKPEDFWYIEALLKCKKGDFWAKVVTKDKDNRYFEEKIATGDFEKLKEAKFKIDKIEKGERKISANPPFDTASLASTCGSLFGWSVKKTATLSQGLYETGKCFLPGTKITNKYGEILDVENINTIGDSVHTMDMNDFSTKIVNCSPVILDHSGNINIISTVNNKIRVTDDHIFPVYDYKIGKIVNKLAKDIIPNNDFLIKSNGYRDIIDYKKYSIIDILRKSSVNHNKFLFILKSGFMDGIRNIEDHLRVGLDIKYQTYYKYIKKETLPFSAIEYLIDNKIISIDYLERFYDKIRYSHPNCKSLKIPFYLDESLCYLAGIVMSDGHISGSLVSLEALLLKNPNKIDASKYVDILGTMNTFMGKFYADKATVSKSLCFKNKMLVCILNSLGVKSGNKSGDINISDFILSSGKRNLLACIAGLFDGDGYFTYNKASGENVSIQGGYTSKSDDIIKTLSIVFSQFGINYKIHRDTRTNISSIKISIYDIDAFSKLIERNSLIKMAVYNGLTPLKKSEKRIKSKNPTNKPINVLIEKERIRAGMTKESLSVSTNCDYWNFFGRIDKNNEIPEDICNKMAKELKSDLIEKMSKILYEKVIDNVQEKYEGKVYCLQTDNSYFLVENGIVSHNCTYIRTDSYNISEEAMTEVRGMIKKTFSKEYTTDKPCVYHKKSKVVAQEAHECIRPVHVEEDGSDIDDSDAKKLYTLIRKRFIACQMVPMVVDTVTYMIKTSSKHDLIAKGQNIKFDGWYKVYDYNTAKEEILPIAEDNEALDLKDIKKTKHSTSAPPRYNEASLVKKLEGEGVGRPSTYATIMESLFKRAYVQKVGKKNALEATELGLKVFDYLDPNFKDFFMDISFTASVEEDLDKIEHGEKGYLETVQKVYNVIEEGIKKTGSSGAAKKFGFGISTGALCECGKGNIVKKKGKFGDFFSCDLYPTCKSIYTKDGEGKFVLKEKKDSVPAEDTGEKCPKCKKGKIVKRKGSYGDFYACNNFPTCKTIFDKGGDDKFTIKEKWSKDSKDTKGSSYKKYPKKEKEEEDGEPSGDSEDDIV